LTPFFAEWLTNQLGFFWVGAYLSLAAAISLVALWMAGPTRSQEQFPISV
jgi:hypothetical protein